MKSLYGAALATFLLWLQAVPASAECVSPKCTDASAIERARHHPIDLRLHARRPEARQVRQVCEEHAQARQPHRPDSAEGLPQAHHEVRERLDLRKAQRRRVLRREGQRQGESVDRRQRGQV